MGTEPENLEGPAMPSVLAGYTGYLLRRVYARASHIAEATMPPGSHPRDFAVLGVLASRDAFSQQELAEQLGINRTLMVRLIDKLESAGYVRRQRNPDDRRSYTLSVTPAGRRARTSMAPFVARGEQQLTAALNADERERLNDLLRTLLPDVDARLPHPLNQRSAYLLLHAYRRLRQQGDEALGALGIQVRSFGALATLDGLAPCSQQQLARRLGLTEPAMVQIVDHLEETGLVERRRNPSDRRQYALELTDVGRSRLHEARQALDAIQAEVAAALGDAGDVELRKLLRKVIDAP